MKTLFKSAPVQVQHLKKWTIFSLYSSEHPYVILGFTRNKKFIRCRKYLTYASYVNVKLEPNTLVETILNLNGNILL